MKKALSNGKLSLQRETLANLAPADLDEVNGGTGGLVRTIVQVSKWACTTITTVQSARIITCK